MGSHSVTCHLAEVHSRPYSSRSWYSIKWPRRDVRLSWPSWLVTYRDVIPAQRWSPIHSPTCINFVHATKAVNYYATPPTTIRQPLEMLQHLFHVNQVVDNEKVRSDTLIGITSCSFLQCFDTDGLQTSSGSFIDKGSTRNTRLNQQCLWKE